ncbi:MAG: hypothetical protein R3F31_06745 [Verrucomicrobiales bacterium]
MAEIIATSERLAGRGTRHVVLTGGEPMVARGIHDLAQAFRERDWHITIETAGTKRPDGIACDLASAQSQVVPCHAPVRRSFPRLDFAA